MGDHADGAIDVLRAVWAADESGRAELDEDCGPTRSCRNMRDVTFDGYAEPGTDLSGAWREKLAREGKLDTSGGSVRDLVIGSSEPR
jgi:hypothetical protein